MFTEIHLKKMKPGIEVFNNQLYWECHEELEHIWIEDRGDPARDVYWAVIQVAAALVHYQNQNLIGAQGMIKKAKEKFLRCEKMENELMNKFLSWQTFKKMTFELKEDFDLNELKPLFDFRFKDYVC
jgi:hypothetical protein